MRLIDCIAALLTLLSLGHSSWAQQMPSTISGSGTTNYFARWTSGTSLGNSSIYQSGAYIGVGTTSPGSTLDIAGDLNVGSSRIYRIGQVPVVSTLGTDNLFLGAWAGVSNISGYDNVFSGSGSGHNNTTGSYNTFAGFQAGYFNTTGGGNTFDGFAAGLDNTTGGQNSFFGLKAGLSNTTGCCNTFIGYSAGFGNQAGSGNSFAGYAAGVNSSGDENTFTGDYAGYFNATGSHNTFNGSYAGQSNTNGSANTYLGHLAGLSNNGSYNIYIGDSSGAGISSENNTIRLGSPSYVSSTFIAGISGVNVSGVTVQINANGQLGVEASSRRYKDYVDDIGDMSTMLMRLRPVRFRYKTQYSDARGGLQYGLLAEEVADVSPELVEYSNDGQPYTVRYQLLIPLLLNEAQKRYRRAEEQAEVIATQHREIQELQLRLSRIEAVIGTRVISAEHEQLALSGTQKTH